MVDNLSVPLPFEDPSIFMKTLRGLIMFHRFQHSHHDLVHSHVHSSHTEELLHGQGNNLLQADCTVSELPFLSDYS
jgi:hypothetical protein